MDLEMFLLLERRNLEQDRQRLLSARQGGVDGQRKIPEDYLQGECPAEGVLRDKSTDIDLMHCNRRRQKDEDSTGLSEKETNASEVFSTAAIKFTNLDEDKSSSAGDGASGSKTSQTPVKLSKSVKEWANHQELNSTYTKEAQPANEEEKEKAQVQSGRRRKHEDDMEQWVSDTFYSYFPGFNNEGQKRQDYLRNRQRENQLNLLKHQMLNPPLPTVRAAAAKPRSPILNTARSGSSTASHGTDKTDLEIIVNNPNYQTPKYSTAASTRHGSTRNRLLQDLRHTALSPLNVDAGGIERSRRSAVEESARKKEYQRELMQQIEEKRRSIEVLREKERKQDEALTRRLQEQLKTIQLEEQLEKEKLRADKLRFDSDQQRLMREQLLAKLEHDTNLLYSNKNHANTNKENSNKERNRDGALKSNTTGGDDDNNKHSNDNNNNNRVYKYFSNSARREYRRGKPLSTDVDFDLDLVEVGAERAERECFHMSEKVCPMCDAPLKSYESCCLRCQRKLSVDTKKQLKTTATLTDSAVDVSGAGSGTGTEGGVGSGKGNETNAPSDAAAAGKAEKVHALGECSLSADGEAVEEDERNCAAAHSFALVCHKCERMYTMCRTCVAQRDICRACHRKLNVCMNCRRTLCTFCLEEIASGRDVESTHINEHEDNEEQQTSNSEGERSFRILEVQFAAQKSGSDVAEFSSSSPRAAVNNKSNSKNNNVNFRHIHNNLHNKAERLPYSINIERNSIFHSDYNNRNNANNNFEESLPKIVDKQLSFDVDSTSSGDEHLRMERVRRETDKRLTRYLQNYGDLAQYGKQRSKSESRHRSTQTTPETVGRRDVVLHEEHNLSMPLLREMPKMTRSESSKLLEQVPQRQRKIDNLKRKWEIPAVQKFIISPDSPHVLTQVGAIRKQLQAEHLRTDSEYGAY